MHTSHPVASTSLIQRVESVSCTLDFHKLPVRSLRPSGVPRCAGNVYLREKVQLAVLFHSGSSRRFYCVGVWGPGPKRGIARHFEKLTQDR